MVQLRHRVKDEVQHALCIYCTTVSQLHQFPDVAALAKKAAVRRASCAYGTLHAGMQAWYNRAAQQHLQPSTHCRHNAS